MKKSTYTIGVDVSSNKCDINIHKDGTIELASMTVNYTNFELGKMIHKINKLVDRKGTVVVMEATGSYYRIPFYRFYNAGFKVVLVNPIRTEAFHKVVSTRKLKTDKVDAHIIALFYDACLLTPVVKPEAQVELKNLIRTYFTLSDECSSYKRRVKDILAQTFFLFKNAFSNTFCKSSLCILKEYSTPEKILSEDTEVLASKIKVFSRKSFKWAKMKTSCLKMLASNSPSVKEGLDSNTTRLFSYIRIIEVFTREITLLKKKIENTAKNLPQYQLLLSIPGIGPITAATILAEIGDFSLFGKPKSLVAFAGIDASVKESGKFKGSEMKMSKRGSKYLRRAIYMVVVCSIRKKRNGQYTNPVLRKYYDLKVSQGKKPKVAIGACMNKVCFYIYATLRNNSPFVLEELRNIA